MNMIRHDDIAPDHPAVAPARNAPFPNEDLGRLMAGKSRVATISACSDEVDWVVEPDPLQPGEMAVHIGF